MEPTVTFVSPLIEPPATFRATSILQMYDFRFTSNDLNAFDFTYTVGIVPTRLITFAIRNITVSHDLLVQLNLPGWIKVDGPDTFMLNRNGEIRRMMVSLNEDDARNRSATTRVRSFSDNLAMVVTPLHVTGPVYVMTNPTPLVDA